MQKDWSVVDVLRHYRHDWLNKIQLIKGNLDIGRMERVHSLIDEVVLQSKNESHLTNMNAERLAERLLTFNWEEHPYVLSYEALSGQEDWSLVEDHVLELTNEIFYMFDQCAKGGYDNSLLLTLKDMEGIHLEFDFQGQILIDDNWNDKIEKLQKNYPSNIVKVEWDNQGCYISICLII
ncbi:Spo0B C-terminal domain-containing protein [Evansella tamaricis]|uniref:Sporulation initiation phosphotransferase B n=1 Tax=Evansella tamaricis TaxID=2069301 RepID=A0ABS6JJX5_9BACI|nr:Spo0B C-terminal domain-containing protein [Evansella tamaricis]MBU9713987.1 sporulation initiation phosphotransferase B [Evansella tamaricis]